MERTIHVTGKGLLKIRPDMTRISISLTDVCKEYAETLERSATDSEALRTVLLPLGFAREDLKTLNFNVDAEYESYRDRSEYKQRFVGYRFRHEMKLEFPSDNALLGKVLYALAHAPVSPEFRIGYSVKDREAAKNRLLAAAVADAKEKAAVLTKAAGVAMQELLTIDYSWGEIEFTSRPVNRMLACKAESPDAAYDLDIEPDDIEVSDTVTLTYRIS